MSSSSERRWCAGTRACFVAVALFLLGAPLVQAALPSAQHNALVDLYNSTNGASWSNKTNWMVAADECTWYGVACDAGHTTVQELQINYNNLNGTLPASFGNLTSLQRLLLTNNQLSGSTPTQLGSLTSLQTLDLSWNQLSGSIPAQLGSLTSLKSLDLHVNQLSGSIPAQLGSLTSLQTLHLDNNQLSGSIPIQLGSLTGLRVLALQGNQLSGSIPTQLGSLTSLQELDLSFNQLSGSIPAQLGSLTSLQYLSMYNNQLSGTIPTQLGSLTTLKALELQYNQLSGSIPTQLGSLTGLQDLNLGHNQLSGSIPAQMGSLISLQILALEVNQLSGSIPPQLGSLAGLRYLGLSLNQLSGAIPAQLGSLTGLGELFLGGNQLSGSIPAQLGSLTGLGDLWLWGNQLSGSIPPELGNLTSLQFLGLGLNQLSGSIPAQLGRLTSLRFLDLGGNELNGSIPTALTNLTSLVPGQTDVRWNALYSTDAALTSFLSAKQYGGNWQSTQTIAPTNLSTSGASASAITVNWTPILYTADGGFYRVRYSTTAGGPYTPFATVTSSKSSSSLTVTGLAANTKYYFVVSTTTLPHPYYNPYYTSSYDPNTVTSGFSAEVSGLTAAQSLPPVVNTFTAVPSTITAGQFSTLSWTTSNATSVSIGGVTGTQLANGSVSVSPTTTAIYRLTATGPGGDATATTTINVSQVTVECSTTVTRISQGQSPWGPMLYDHVDETIAGSGCALTSLAMVLNSTGVLPPTDPGTLNSLMNVAHTGFGDCYSKDGGVRWAAAADAMGMKFVSISGGSQMDGAVCNGHPVIVGVPWKGKSPGHFVVVTGRHAGDYSIADPGYSTKTQLLKEYGSFSTRGYVIPKAISLEWLARVEPQATTSTSIDIEVSDRADIQVRDEVGRYVGRDPVSGGIRTEIPGAAYFEDTLVDDVTGESALPTTRTVHLDSPSSVNYQVTLLGLSSGKYTMTAYTLGGSSGVQESEPVVGFISASAQPSFSVSLATPTPDLEHISLSITALIAEVQAAAAAQLIKDSLLVATLVDTLGHADRSSTDADRVRYLLTFQNALRSPSPLVDSDAATALLRDADVLIARFGGYHRHRRRAVGH